MSQLSFADVLRKKNPVLHQRLEEMRSRALEEWIHLLKPDSGSHSGFVHLRNVERNADKMIPAEEKERFSDGEIFLLLSSILFHDLGRIIPDGLRHRIRLNCADEPVLLDEASEPARTALLRLLNSAIGATFDLLPCELDTSNPLEPALNLGTEVFERCPFPRQDDEPTYPGSVECDDPTRRCAPQKTHACRSRHVIGEYWAVFGLPDEQIARLCSMVAFWHQLDAPPSRNSPCQPVRDSETTFRPSSLDPYGGIRVPMIAAILRIADETEDSWTRAVRQHWYEQFLKVGSPSDQLYKAFRRGVADVEFAPRAHCIVMHLHHLLATNSKHAELVGRMAKKIDGTRRALCSWSRLLASAGVNYSHTFIQQEGKLSLTPLVPGQPGPSLRAVFETPVRDRLGSTIQGPFLSQHKTAHYLDAIMRLIQGTRDYRHFRWSAVEGAIGEPLTDKIKWVIERIGKAHPALTIVVHDERDEVEIALEHHGAREKTLRAIQTSVLAPEEH